MNKTLVGIIAVVVIIGAVVMLGGESSQNKQAPPTPTQRVMDQNKNQVSEVSVEATAQGFVPNDITIKTGTKVVWTNKSGNVLTVDSAQHPTHLVYPPLNLGQFEDGKSVSLIFDKPGKYFYHNHLNATQFGSVTVE